MKNELLLGSSVLLNGSALRHDDEEKQWMDGWTDETDVGVSKETR